MARSSGLLGAALAVVIAVVMMLQACQLFVASPYPASPRRSPQALRAATDTETETATEEDEAEEEIPKPEFRFDTTVPYRGIDLDGDKLDNLDEWYEETISGKGGMPTGILRDLILRSFFGTFDSKNWLIPYRDFTGPNKQPCATDYQTAYETMKTNMKEGKIFQGSSDGNGWIWLVAGQNPAGLYLYLMKAPPWGERPLALIKEDNIDEFFEKVNWHMLFVRLHKWQLWGGRASKFPYPVAGEGLGTTR